MKPVKQRNSTLPRQQPLWTILLLVLWLACKPDARAQGTIDMTGSIALANLMTAWAQAYNLTHPEIPISVASPGSAAGFEALVQGTADLVLLGAPLPDRERQRFIEHYQHPPLVVPVVMDGIAVFVHRNNPLERVNIPQLDAIYSITLKCGARQPIRKWGELGITGSLASSPILIAGLDSYTGANQIFRKVALCGGDFRKDFKALAGPADVAALIENDERAMGFAGSALRSAVLRPLAIARAGDSPAYLPTETAIRKHRYPLSRTLSLAINAARLDSLPLPIRSFVDYIRSPKGQDIARKAGYVPLP